MLASQVQNIGSETKVVNEQNTKELHSPFRKTMFFINDTTEDVVVVNRNNLPVFVRRAVNGVVHSKEFIVRSIYKFQNNAVIVEVINMLTEYQKLNGSGNEELETIRLVLTEAFDTNRSIFSCEIVVDSRYPISNLSKLKVCYAPCVDLLLMSKDYHANIHHPYSAEGRTVRQFKDMGLENIYSGATIQVVDNDNRYGKRFIKMGKSLIEVEPIKDPSRSNGVYYTELKSKDGSMTTIPSILGLDEAQDKLGLYPTAEQALSDDQAEQLSKQKLLIMQNELEASKASNSILLEQAKKETEAMRAANEMKTAELNETRFTFEQTLLETKKLVAELETKAKMAKMEYEMLKDKLNTETVVLEDNIKQKSRVRDDYYDSRSAERKDSSEYLKMAGAGLVTGLGVWAAMRKFS
jgi:hypothetical protein